MAKNQNWFGDPPPSVVITPTRLVRFGTAAQSLVPGAATALNTVYLERERAAAKKVVSDEQDFVLRLVSE